MFFNFPVSVPDAKGKLVFRDVHKGKIINGQPAEPMINILYEYSRTYNPKTQTTTPKRVVIGQLIDPNDNSKMYPNSNFYKYFPENVQPAIVMDSRSCCLRIGAYVVIEKIMKDYGLSGMIAKQIGKNYGLFLDLVTYTIVTEDNAGQYYPDYAYNHPLFTTNMKVYSDSTVCSFLGNITIDQSVRFMNEWNETRDHREKIYISYDSSNKICQAGDVEIAEIGHSKEGVKDKPIINYSVAYDTENSEPLFYEDYCGSVVDVSQLQYMLERAKGYGYRKVGFILDRGYFSEPNIHYMDHNGYDFIIMMKGMKKLAAEVIEECIGKFEKKRQNRIKEYRISGMTVTKKMFPSDEKNRYFHVFYNDFKAAGERDELEKKLEKLNSYLKKNMGESITIPDAIKKYFDIVYWHEGQKDQKFMHGIERTSVIDRETALCGYFIIITSQKMIARDALLLYKSRDANEKLFRGDKSYLGNKAYGTQSLESTEAKMFIEFAALIVRNKMYRQMKEYMIEKDIKRNYLDVPAAIRELDKIEMISDIDGIYHMRNAVTKTQKTILDAFGLDENYVRERAKELSIQLEGILKNEQKNTDDR